MDRLAKRIPAYLVAVGVSLVLMFLTACDRFREVEFDVVANNINSPDLIIVYIAGEGVGGITLGTPVRFTTILDVSRETGTTGPSNRQVCFPISGHVHGKGLASRSISVCPREGQITTVDFEISRGVLELRAQVR